MRQPHTFKRVSAHVPLADELRLIALEARTFGLHQ
jgi:hypothetical protein